jgi:hypothetical protein
MTTSGIDDCAAYIHSPEADTYGIRYTELIAPMVKTIQYLLDKVESLTARVEALEAP